MATRNETNARNEVLETLKQDHRRMEQAFRDFDRLGREDYERCEDLVHRTCAEIEVHSALEEELFYPLLRETIAPPALIDDAEVEHQTLETLILELDRLAPDEDKYAASFRVLGEYTRHHIRDEEARIFEQVLRAKVDWEALLQEMQKRRVDVMEEIGLEPSESDIEVTADKNNRRAVRTTPEISD
jgi:hypothetical protein